MTQADAFFRGEGDQWLKRNKQKLKPKKDLILYALSQLTEECRNGKYLEIGCANGWRLNEIKKTFNAESISGVEPSLQGSIEALKNGVDVVRGDATNLPWSDEFFDVVIYGFCLYLCDRKDLFKIVAEGDRVLKNGGLMIIHDFSDFDEPCKVPYKHKAGLWSFKQDYEEMFLASPAYSFISFDMTLELISGVTVLKKDIEKGWPCVSEY